MKKLTIILVLMFAVVSFSGYRALAIEDVVDDFTVTETETTECPMPRDGTGDGIRLRDGSGEGTRKLDGTGEGLKKGQMMNRTDRRFQNRDTD